MITADRQAILGAIIGGAIGDAMGSSFEGRESSCQYDDLARWQLTDDTQLTLATCQAIAEHRDFDAAVIAEYFLQWYRHGRINGIGAATYKALTELSHGAHWALTGRRGEMAAGNGAAMRIAPLAFSLDPALSAERQLIRDICRITHHNEEAYIGALAIIFAIRAAWQRQWNGKDDLLKIIISQIPDSSVRDRLIEIDRDYPDGSLLKIAEKFGSSAYVVESVPLALIGAQRVLMLGFRQLLIELISAGGDTDTIASMAGQIAGTLIGYDNIPQDLIDRLPERTLIIELTDRYIAQL